MNGSFLSFPAGRYRIWKAGTSRLRFPPDALRGFLLSATLWTPICCLLWTFAFSSDDFWLSLGLSLIIAETAMSTCYWGAKLISAGERAYLVARGLPFPKRSKLFDVLSGCLFMWPGMYFGFEIAGVLSPFMGIDWHTPDFGNYKRGLIVGLFNASLVIAFVLRKDANQLRERAEKDRREFERTTLRAQIGALTAQMHPHLLFNSLNSIASMITAAPDKAEDMTVELGVLYRRVLEATKKDLHSLADELELCRSYLQIEQARFEDRIHYEIEVQEGIDPSAIKLPVLCLQPLVENAIKHGLLPRAEGGKVSVQIHRVGEDLTILVEDDGIGMGHATSKGSGTALDNCRSRLKLAFGDTAHLALAKRQPQGTTVKIQIPAFGENP